MTELVNSELAAALVGALIGSLAAGLIALLLSRRDEKRVVARERRSAFGALIAGLLDLSSAMDVDRQALEDAHRRIAKQMAVWRLLVDAPQDQRFAEDVGAVLTLILGGAEDAVRKAGQGERASDLFAMPGRPSRERRDGFVAHGRVWHNGTPKERAEARAWFRQAAEPMDGLRTDL